MFVGYTREHKSVTEIIHADLVVREVFRVE